MRTFSLDSLCCFLPPDPNDLPRYTEINDRLNAIDQRTRRKSITGRVDTVRFRIGSEHVASYEYRDKAELDLVQYLETHWGIRYWSRRTVPLDWAADDGAYQTVFPFEAWQEKWLGGGLDLYVIVDAGVTKHPLWHSFLFDMLHGVRPGVPVDLDYGHLVHIDREHVNLHCIDREPWCFPTTKATSDLLLQHRATNNPSVVAAIKGLLASTSSMSVRDIVGAVGHPDTYSQVIQMIWANKLRPRDCEAVLGMGTRVIRSLGF